MEVLYGCKSLRDGKPKTDYKTDAKHQNWPLIGLLILRGLHIRQINYIWKKKIAILPSPKMEVMVTKIAMIDNNKLDVRGLSVFRY